MKKHEFSLVELLVIVAIIGILMSLLLPSLKNARSVAKSAVCMTNLKNTGVADLLYAQDENSWFNPNQPMANISNDRWAKNETFRKYTGWDAVSSSSMIPNELACPESIDKCRQQDVVEFTEDAVKDLWTYGPFAIYGNKNYRGLHASWIEAPSQLGRAGDVWAGWQFSQNDYDPRHNNKVNIVYHDVHATSMSNSKVGSAYNSADPWIDSNGWNLTNINDSRHQ